MYSFCNFVSFIFYYFTEEVGGPIVYSKETVFSRGGGGGGGSTSFSRESKCLSPMETYSTSISREG